MTDWADRMDMTQARIRQWWQRNASAAQHIPKAQWDELDAAIRADERAKVVRAYTEHLAADILDVAYKARLESPYIPLSSYSEER